MRLFVVVAALAGCGRVGFDPAGDGGRGDHDVSQLVPDAGMQACAAFGPFGTPVKLNASLQTPADDWAPTFADGDRLFVDYVCGLGGSCNLQSATRATTADDFPPVQTIVGLSTGASNEVSPSLTRDGRTIVYSSDVSGVFRMVSATRATPADSWGPAVRMTELDSTGQERDGFVSGDGLRIVFVSTRGAGGIGRLYEAVRASTTVPFGLISELAPLDTSGNQITPTLSADGLEILFASNRSGGPGGFDIYRATRTSLAQPFGAPALVSELSTAQDDLQVRLSDDGATVYLDYGTSASGGANADLYAATRSCL